MSELSIIIVTYNIENIIGFCLESLQKQSYKKFEVIIVDNGSEDYTINLIKKYLSFFPKAKLIQNDRNIGTCAARNQALNIARGKYIMTLDSDVVLTENFLKNSINFLKLQHKKVGLMGVKIMQMETKNLIDSTGLVLSKNVRFYDRGYGEIDKGQYYKDEEIFGACAAAAIYKKEMLEDIKEDKDEYFDSRFFYLVEDFDIALRAKIKGWKTIYCPEAIAYHKRNGSDTNEKIRQYLTFRNRYYFLLKNRHFKHIDKSIFKMVFYDTIRLVYMFFSNPCAFRAIKEIVEFYIKEKYHIVSRADRPGESMSW